MAAFRKVDVFCLEAASLPLVLPLCLEEHFWLVLNACTWYTLSSPGQSKEGREIEGAQRANAGFPPTCLLEVASSSHSLMMFTFLVLENDGPFVLRLSYKVIPR